MTPSRPAILDTSVYIELLRHGHFQEPIARLPYLVRHAAVVLAELRRGAVGKRELGWVDDLEARARVFSPGVAEWRRSGEILAALRVKRGYEARKLLDLHFDALTALTARAIGAVVITCDGDDFGDIRAHADFDLEVWRKPPPATPSLSRGRRRGAS